MQDLRREQKALPTLEGWLHKKGKKGQKKWIQKWVIVRESHMLWTEKQKTIAELLFCYTLSFGFVFFFSVLWLFCINVFFSQFRN